jgi:biopolymer transport protein ExbB/TolQ
MEELFLGIWPLICGGLVSAGVVVGTVRAVSARLDREFSQMKQEMQCVKKSVDSLKEQAVMRSECERSQTRCESAIARQLTAIASQLADYRAEHKHDLEAVYNRFNALLDATQAKLYDLGGKK